MSLRTDPDASALEAMREIAKVAGIPRNKAEMQRRAGIQIIVRAAILRCLSKNDPRRRPGL